MATSPNGWTINSNTLDQLVTTHLPMWETISSNFQLNLPQPNGYTAGTVIDDFSPDDRQSLRFVPFSQLDNIIRDGDVVVFMEPSASFDPEHIAKQRGWHIELAFRNADGMAVQCAPWGDQEDPKTIRDTLCSQLAQVPRFTNEMSRMNLHIFRIAESCGAVNQIAGLLGGAYRWRTILNKYHFPPDYRGHPWYSDPLEFTNLEELKGFATKLISTDIVPTMLCVQWVHAILSLSLNLPLNHNTLTQLGVLDTYESRWKYLGFTDDALVPLGRLPSEPSSHIDLSSEICALYLGMKNPPITLLSLLSHQFCVCNIPPLTLLPIFPLSEYRKPNHTGNVQWDYVISAFPDSICMTV